MKIAIATIVPIPHLESQLYRSGYEMALAHLVPDPDYAAFFWRCSSRGDHVILDNGVIETGQPLDVLRVLAAAKLIGATEMVLPDMLNDDIATLRLGSDALERLGEVDTQIQLMAVPQGPTLERWKACLRDMLSWDDVTTIGISRRTAVFGMDRLQILKESPELFESGKQIHLLGCAGDPIEIFEIEEAFPGKIRSVDSGIAAIYTAAGKSMRADVPKPDLELDFRAKLDEELLHYNVQWWLTRAVTGYALIRSPLEGGEEQ